MKPQMSMHFETYRHWSPVGRYDSLAAELADRHYSRQTVGADGYMPPGECVAFIHRTPTGSAVWTAVLNIFRDEWRWRNTLFRNESKTLTSELIISATAATYAEWRREYGKLPDVPLTTEIAILETAHRRGKRHEPGHCYRIAGWTEIKRTERGHGRPARCFLKAPEPT